MFVWVLTKISLADFVVSDMMEDERKYEHEKTDNKPTENYDKDIDTNAFLLIEEIWSLNNLS